MRGTEVGDEWVQDLRGAGTSGSSWGGLRMNRTG